MPYITGDERQYFTPEYPQSEPTTPGQLNYAITRLIVNYLEGGYNYQIINDVLGALEGAKLEFYRRVAVPYEDKKILENGDVY